MLDGSGGQAPIDGGLLVTRLAVFGRVRFALDKVAQPRRCAAKMHRRCLAMGQCTARSIACAPAQHACPARAARKALTGKDALHCREVREMALLATDGIGCLLAPLELSDERHDASLALGGGLGVINRFCGTHEVIARPDRYRPAADDQRHARMMRHHRHRRRGGGHLQDGHSRCVHEDYAARESKGNRHRT